MNLEQFAPNRRFIRQACAIPFRALTDGTEFCLITSIKRKRWGFPKGIIDPGESLVETALKEAFEEAGLRGQIVGQPLGTYGDSKWGAKLEVTVVMMEVHESFTAWDEADQRQRRWLGCDAAAEIIRVEHKPFLLEAAERLSEV